MADTIKMSQFVRLMFNECTQEGIDCLTVESDLGSLGVRRSGKIPVTAVITESECGSSLRVTPEIMDIVLESIKAHSTVNICRMKGSKFVGLRQEYRVIPENSSPYHEMILLVREVLPDGTAEEKYRATLMQSKLSKGIAICYEAITTLAQEFSQKDS